MAQEANVGRYWKKLTGGVFYGWWIVVLGSLIQVVGGGILYHGITVFFLPLKRDLMVSSAAVSLLYGAARLEGGFEGAIVGPLIDRFGPRVMIIAGASLAGVGLILLSTVHSFLAVFLIYVFVVYLGYNAGFFHPVSTAVNSWFIRYRGTGFALIVAAVGIGGMVLAPVLSHLILNFGWRVGAVTAGLIILLVAIPAALPIHRSPEVRGLCPDGRPWAQEAGCGLVVEKPEPTRADFTVRQAFRTYSYWLLALSITLRILVTVALTVHFVPIVVWKGMSEAVAAYLVSLFALISIFTTLVMGSIGDRWSKTLLCAVGVLPILIVMLALALSDADVALYAFPVGLAVALGTAPLNWSLIGDLFGRRSYATLRGIMGFFYGTATFLSPVYAGWVFDRSGSYDNALITFSIVLLVAAILFVLLHNISSWEGRRSLLHL